MGRIHKQPNTQLDRYRLRWNDVKYAPGEIKVVAYDENGKQVAEKTIRTAGQPAVLDMKEERSVIASDGEDLAYITLSMLDKDGNECPTANQSISSPLKEQDSLKAACNGDATSLEPFTQPRMKLFSGKLVLIVQSNGKKGDIIVKAKADNGIENKLVLKAQ